MSSSVPGEIMDLDLNLDLNQEPSSDSESQNGLMNEISPWLNELETAHERIEERIRQLESIVSRIRERETSSTTTTTTTTTPNRDSTTAGVIHERSRERLNGDNNKNKTYLIAKALNMEKTSSVPGGGYFDCNICLEKANDPILTCCGHLFCWRCFYQLPLIYLNIKECPVCDGEVTDSEVIPIYGNGDDCDNGTKTKSEDCGILIPPRPNAKRVESIRQKIINRTIPLIPVHETIEHIRRTIDSIGLQALAQGDEFGLTNIITNGGGGPLRLLPPHMPPFGLVVETPVILQPFDDATFDVDSFVDTRRRSSSRVYEYGPSPSPPLRASFLRNRSRSNGSVTPSQNVSFAVTSSPREFAVPSSSTSRTELVSSVASTSRRRTDDVNNGPRTRSRRRLR